MFFSKEREPQSLMEKDCVKVPERIDTAEKDLGKSSELTLR